MPAELPKTWDDQRLKSQRLERLQAEMRRQDIGAMYLYDGINVRYVLGTYVPGGAVFVPGQGEAIGLVRPRDLGYVQLKHANSRRAYYNTGDLERGDVQETLTTFAGKVNALLAEHGAASQLMAVDHLDPMAVLALAGAGIRITNAQTILERARSVKTDDEVAIYRSIGEQYAHTMTAFRQALRPGVTENQLASVVVSAWYDAGGEDIAQLNVCAGENMNPWRRWPSQRPVVDGEFVGIDLHGRGIHGLRGDMSRTFFVGDRPTQEQRDLYKQAYDYLFASIDVVRAGRPLEEVRQLSPLAPEKYQTQLYHYSIIHGIGMNHSGHPKVDKPRKPEDDVLEKNQIVAVECYFGEEGSPLAVKLEEDVIVREGAPERLSPAVPFDERFIG